MKNSRKIILIISNLLFIVSFVFLLGVVVYSFIINAADVLLTSVLLLFAIIIVLCILIPYKRNRLFKMIRINIDLENYDECKRVINEYISKSIIPFSKQIGYFHLVLIYFMTDEIDKAKEYINIKCYKPLVFHFKYHEFLIYLDEGDYNKAIEIFAQLEKLYSKKIIRKQRDVKLLFLRASVYMKLYNKIELSVEEHDLFLDSKFPITKRLLEKFDYMF